MESNSADKGKATFTIKIDFQQHYTWQGVIFWVEGGKSQKFRSELEMMKLMMEALAEHNDKEQEPPSWDEGEV